jgi:hypothetical protein
MIAIGRTTYTRMAFPPTPDGSELPEAMKKATEVFQRFEAPTSGVSPTDGSLAQIHALAEAPEVERDGAGFRWRTGSGRGAVSGDADIANGRIASFTFEPETPEWSGGAVTYRFTDYDSAPAVEPPPADRVTETTTSTTIKLPAATVTGRSPLELRRVIAVRSGPCSAVTGAYGAGEVRLDGPEGCYRLGAILATIRQAEARPESAPDGVTVSLDLSPADSAAVRSALSGQYQRQFAMVMFGRVLSAPIVQDPEPSADTIAVSPVDPQTAANIIRSLGS